MRHFEHLEPSSKLFKVGDSIRDKTERVSYIGRYGIQFTISEIVDCRRPFLEVCIFGVRHADCGYCTEPWAYRSKISGVLYCSRHNWEFSRSL
jgi:hypothetical protein